MPFEIYDGIIDPSIPNWKVDIFVRHDEFSEATEMIEKFHLTDVTVFV